MWSEEARQERFYKATKTDQRPHFARDRDRILYSSAFHRLAGVTQVVRAGDQEIFHTRQQHSLKVAQIGRRLAELCLERFPKESAEIGVHPEVVEAACLAHDLGHPPFGHVGESLLDQRTKDAGDINGFEGNAQTFRILTQLGIRFQECPGLDLTRATLAATLKYPWMRDEGNPDRSSKWSSYEIDRKQFEFARKFHEHDHKTAEAALMDWADDIAYSVHDLEDFHRGNAIPWIDVFDSRDDIIASAKEKWHNAPVDADSRLGEAFNRLEDLLVFYFDELLFKPYMGKKHQRFLLRNMTSILINRLINAVSLSVSESPVHIFPEEAAEVLILKQIFRHSVIKNPSLVSLQHGQRKILEGLHEAIFTESAKGFPKLLSVKMLYLWELEGTNRARFTADCIASLTEREAVGMYRRLFGIADTSILDPIIR